MVSLQKAASVLNFSVTTGGNTTNHSATMQFIKAGDNTSFLSWLFYGNSIPVFRMGSAYGTLNFNANNSGISADTPVNGSSHSSITVSNPSATVIRTVIEQPSTQLNIAGGIEGITLGIHEPFAIKFAPKLPKNSLNKLTLTYEFAFTRI